MYWVIIGGGTSGAYVASRLLDYNQNVLILEQGGNRFSDENCILKDKIGKVMYNGEYTKEITVNNKTSVRMGSGLGGGSAVNGGYMVYESRENLKKMGIDVEIQEILKYIFPKKIIPAGDVAKKLAREYGGQARDDYLYIDGDYRVSSLSFLANYINNPNLIIKTGVTVNKIEGNKIYTNDQTIISDKIIISCGAGTPELLLRSNLPVCKVRNHVGVEIKPLENVGAGQVYFGLTESNIKQKAGGNYQVLFYNESIIIYNMRPSGYWLPKLSSRGDMYYDGEMLTDSDKLEINNIAHKIMEVIPCKPDIIENSFSYHMCGGCPKKELYKGVYVVDLSILPSLPEGNTSWTAFLIAEEFIQNQIKLGILN